MRKVTDFLGNELNPGDKVIYTKSTSGSFSKGIVLATIPSEHGHWDEVKVKGIGKSKPGVTYAYRVIKLYFPIEA